MRKIATNKMWDGNILIRADEEIIIELLNTLTKHTDWHWGSATPPNEQTTNMFDDYDEICLCIEDKNMTYCYVKYFEESEYDTYKRIDAQDLINSMTKTI